MKKEIFEISGITCLAYEEKKPEYLIIQPINEPHAQMLARQVSFMINNTEKGFLLIAFLVKNWTMTCHLGVHQPYLGKKALETVQKKHGRL